MKKTDESVKTGLKIEGNQKNTGDSSSQPEAPIPTEKDADELVHEQDPEVPDMKNEQDIDDVVHTIPPADPNIGKEERDMDDLVHQNPGSNEAEENY